MSVWGDIRKRGNGSEIKKEDDIRSQWIRQMIEYFPENDFRKLYMNDGFVIDYADNLTPNKPVKSFEPIDITWGDKFDFKSWKL